MRAGWRANYETVGLVSDPFGCGEFHRNSGNKWIIFHGEILRGLHGEIHIAHDTVKFLSLPIRDHVCVILRGVSTDLPMALAIFCRIIGQLMCRKTPNSTCPNH